LAKLPKKNDGWGAIAQYIISAETNKSWQDDPPLAERNLKRKVRPSFTQWGKDRASEIGISEFQFWQYRRAGLIYNMLPTISNVTPEIPLAELSTQISPDYLNELQKIYRIAPKELFDELCQRIVTKKDIGRQELRRLWESLRPALHGTTGRSRSITLSDIHSAFQTERSGFEVLEGLVIVALKEIFPKLLGLSCRAPIVDIRELPSDRALLIDVVVVAPGKSPVDIPVMHGFSFLWHKKYCSLPSFNECLTEYQWIVHITEELSEDNSPELPNLLNSHPRFGVIKVSANPNTFNADKLKIVKHAQLCSEIQWHLRSQLDTRILLQELPLT